MNKIKFKINIYKNQVNITTLLRFKNGWSNQKKHVNLTVHIILLSQAQTISTHPPVICKKWLACDHSRFWYKEVDVQADSLCTELSIYKLTTV